MPVNAGAAALGLFVPQCFPMGSRFAADKPDKGKTDPNLRERTTGSQRWPSRTGRRKLYQPSTRRQSVAHGYPEQDSQNAAGLGNEDCFGQNCAEPILAPLPRWLRADFLVRSVTLTSMIFMIPIPAATSAIKKTDHERASPHDACD